MGASAPPRVSFRLQIWAILNRNRAKVLENITRNSLEVNILQRNFITKSRLQQRKGIKRKKLTLVTDDFLVAWGEIVNI